MRRIGLIGVGLLGTSVASRLLQAGFEVSGYDTLPGQLSALAAQGLHPKASVAEVAADAEAVFVILPTLESVEEVFLAPGGLSTEAPAGTVLIQMSTISPALTRRLAAELAGTDTPFLDAPMLGTSVMVASGDCTILVAGDADVARDCDPLFAAIGRSTIHMGDAGSASLAKLATNLMVALNTSALAESLVLAAKGGIAPGKMLDVLRGSAAYSRMMDIRGPMMQEGAYPPQMKLELFLKDIRLMMEEAQTLGVSLPLTGTAQQLYRSAGEAGAGGQDLAVVMTELERLAGISR